MSFSFSIRNITILKLVLSFSFCHQKENRNKRKSAKTS